MVRFLLFLVLFVVLVRNACGQTLAAYGSANAAGTGAAAALSNANASGLTRGAGIAQNSGSTFNSNGFNDATDDYLAFSFTVDAGFQASLSNLLIRYDRSNSGPAELTLAYSLDAFVSSSNTFFTDNAVSSAGESQLIDLSGITELQNLTGTVSFRVYPTNAASTGGTFDIEAYTSTTTLGVANPGILLEGTLTPLAACPHTVTDFTPTSGPAGTEVILTGTGFTSSTSVSFNGTPAASVSFTSATEIVAVVPAGATSGAITITESGCDVATSTSFTVLTTSGACGSGISGLLITEVYDNESGSIGYIEIYNGTGAVLDASVLSDYRIDRYANLATGTSSHSYTFPAGGYSAAQGDVLVFRVSTNANVGGVLPDATLTGSTAGFNGSDRLELVQISSGNVIDNFHADRSDDGYSAVRNTSVTSPNPTYNAAEWVQSDAPDDTPPATLGSHGTPTPPPTITVQPSDQTACNASFELTASGTTLSYQWYYNEGNTANWTAVPAGSLNGATVTGVTSTSLALSGDLSGVNGYQFYAEVTQGAACSRISDAAQLDLNPGRYYRSRTSGNWNAVSTWEVATTSGGSYVPACLIPNFSNSDEILIVSGTTVTINTNRTAANAIDQATVEAGGTLVLNDVALAFHDGAGVDFSLLGTYRDNSGTTVVFDGAASWELGANATYIKTHNGGLAVWREQYEGGISNIPATAHWYFQYEGQPLTTVAVDMFYPNLYFISNSGAFDGGNFAEAFTGGSGGFATVKGNFEVGTEGSGTVVVYNNSINAQPMRILGDLIVESGSTLTNASYDGNSNSGRGEGTGFEVRGNITVRGTLVVDNQISTAADNLLLLSGTTAQSISGSGTFTLHNLHINNSSTLGVTLSGLAAPLEVSGTLTLDDGYVNTRLPDGLLALTADALVSPSVTNLGAGSAESFVNGPLRKTFSAAEANGTTLYDLPLGKNDNWAPAGLRPNGVETFTAEYFHNGYGTYERPACMNQLSDRVYWQIDRTGTQAAGIRLYWKQNIGVSPIPAERNLLKVARFNGTSWEEADEPGNCTNTDLVFGDENTGFVETDLLVANFSPFTPTSPIPQNPLPVTWLSFRGLVEGHTAQLYWETAEEVDNAGFYVEKSSDGRRFHELDFVEPAPEYVYRFSDKTLFSPAYYRLRQVDKSGTFAYSKVIYLSPENKGVPHVFPNPFTDRVRIGGLQGALSVRLSRTDGSTLWQADLEFSALESRLNAHLKSLPKGIYFLELRQRQGAFIRKLVKK